VSVWDAIFGLACVIVCIAAVTGMALLRDYECCACCTHDEEDDE
jgi:hypothetical protein